MFGSFTSKTIEGKETDENEIPSDTFSDEPENEGDKTDNEFKLEKTSRSHRFSSPTYHEISSLKGRLSHSKLLIDFVIILCLFLGRKSGFFDVDQGKNGNVNMKEDSSMVDEYRRSRGSDSMRNEKIDEAYSITNTDENLTSNWPPTFKVNTPIMSAKKNKKSLS